MAEQVIVEFAGVFMVIGAVEVLYACTFPDEVAVVVSVVVPLTVQ